MRTNLNQLQVIIFDLDGVIIDTEALHAQAKRTAIEKYQIKVPEQLYVEFRGRSDQGIFEWGEWLQWQ